MADITLARPAQGQTLVVRSAADSRIVLGFPAGQATLEKAGDNLVFRFDDGGSVELQDFYRQHTGESIPEFEVEGQIIAGADFFSAFGPDIAPAAGPGGAAGGGRYQEYANADLADGLAHLSELDWSMQTGAEDAGDGTAFGGVPDLPTGIGMAWVNAWTGGSNTGTDGPDGSSLASADSGLFTLRESGLAGGTREAAGPIRASSMLAITTENSNFDGMTIDGQRYSLAELAAGVDAALDLDNDGDTDVSVSFLYIGNNSVSVTVTLDSAVSHVDSLGNALAEALAGLGLTAHDDRGNSASGALNVAVVDDSPEARDNAADADLGTASVTGNVVTDADAEGSADKFGADGEANDRVDWLNADGLPDIKFGDTALTRDPNSGKLTDNDGNDYGTLALDESTGGYTYTKPAGSAFEGDIAVAYTIEDADGDRTSAALTIAVTDRGVSIGGTGDLPGGAADAVASEAFLSAGGRLSQGSDGSNAPQDSGADSNVAEGSFTVSAPDKLAQLTINGAAVDLDNPAATAPIETELGTLIVTAITGGPEDGYTVAYKYTLERSTTDVAEAIEKDTFEIAVKDGDGDTSAGFLSIAIEDDRPVARDDAETMLLSQTSISGNVTGNDIFGADGTAADKIDWLNADGTADIKFGDTALTRAVNGKLTDNDGNDYGTLALDESTGEYTYTKPVNSAVDLNDDLTVAYTIEDADGDRTSAALTIAVTDRGIGIGGTGDLPGGEADAIVHERGLPDGTDPGDSREVTATFTVSAPDGLDGFEINGQRVAAGTAIPGDHGTLTVNEISAPDADGVYTVNYTYTLERSTTDVDGAIEKDTFEIAVKDSDGDTSAGFLSIAIEDDTPVARDDAETMSLSQTSISGNVTGNDIFGADGTAADKIDWLNADGTADIKFGDTALTRAVNGKLTDNAGNDYGTLALDESTGDYTYTKPVNSAVDLNDDLTVAYTIEDADGDRTSAALTIAVTDRGISIDGVTHAIVHERGLPGGTAQGDGSSEVRATFTVSAPDGLDGFAINGQPVAAGMPIHGVHGFLTVDGISAPDADGVYIVDYTYRLIAAPDAPGDFSGDDFIVTVTDSDGDTRTHPLHILIEDDRPEAYDNAADADPGTVSVTGNVVIDADAEGRADIFGADGEAADKIDWLNEHGQPDIKFGDTALTRDSDTGKLTDNNGNDYGTLALDESTGEYTYTKPAGSAFVGDITVAYTIEDRDGDRSSAALTITVTDRGVDIGEAVAFVQESGLPGGTAPGVGSEITATFTVSAPDGLDGFAINGQPVAAGTAIPGDYGTLTVNGILGPDADGVYIVDYTYTLTEAPHNTAPGTAPGAIDEFISRDAFTVTVTDSDGDTRTGPLNILIEDDGPVARDDLRALTLEKADGVNVTTEAISGNVISGLYKGSDNSGKDTPGADGFEAGSVEWNTTAAGTDNEKSGSHEDQTFNTAFSLEPASGQPGVYNVVDANGGKNVGTITLRPDGNYEFAANAAYEPEHGNHTLSIPYTFRDGDGDTAGAELRITINNVNDKPVITHVDNGDVKEDGVYAAGVRTDTLIEAENATPTTEGGTGDGQHKFTTTGTVSATDADSDLLTFGLQGGGAGGYPGTGEPCVVLGGVYGALYLLPDSGQYTYVLDPGKANALGEGKSASDSFTVTATDNSGADADKATGTGTIRITVHGSNEAPTLEAPVTLTVTEANANTTVNGTFSIPLKGHDADTGDTLTYKAHLPGSDTLTTTLYLKEGANGPEWTTSMTGTIDSYYGHVSITAGKAVFTLYNGSRLVQAMDDGDLESVTLPVTVQDQHGAYAERELQIDIKGTNDAPKVSAVETASVKEDGVHADGKPASGWGDGEFIHPDENTATTDGNAADPNGPADGPHHEFRVTGSLLGRVTDADDVVGGDNNEMAFSLVGVALKNNAGQNVTATTLTDSDEDGLYDVKVGAEVIGHVSLTAGGDYVFTLEQDAGYVDSLAEGEKLTLEVTYKVSDGTDSSNGILRVTVNGTNDLPELTLVPATAIEADDILMLSAKDDADAGQEHGLIAGLFADEDAAGQTATGVFRINDADASDMKAGHDIRVTSENTGASGTDTAGAVADNTMIIKGEYGDLHITRNENNTSTHAGDSYSYEYRLDPARAGKLDAGEAGHDDFSVAIRDQFGAHDSRTLTFAVLGSEDPTQINAHLLAPDGSAVEAGVDLPVNTRGLSDEATHKAQYVNEVDTSTVTGHIGASDTDVSDQASLGDGGADAKLHYIISTSDGDYDLNDLLNSLPEGQTSLNIVLSHGTLSVSANTGPVNGETPPFRYEYALDNDDPGIQKLARGERTEDEFTVRIVENGTVIDFSPVVVTITGTNDRPVIDVKSATTAMTEDDFTVTGRIKLTDYEQLPEGYNETTKEWESAPAKVDSGFRFSLVKPDGVLDEPLAADPDESKFNLGSDTFMVQGTYGWLELNSVTGEYTYHRTANLNDLNNAESVQDVFHVRVMDADGAYSEIKPLAVTITGNDDTGLGSAGGSGNVHLKEDGVTRVQEDSAQPGFLRYDEGVADVDPATPAPGYRLGANAPAGSAGAAVITGQLRVSDPDTTDQPADLAAQNAAYTFSAGGAESVEIKGNTATAVEDDAVSVLSDSPSDETHGQSVGYHTAYGDILLYPDGHYTFTPARAGDGALADVINNLALGETVTVSLPVTATNTTETGNKGETAGGAVTVTITGTNDAPEFISETDGDLVKANLWQMSGNLKDDVRDADHGAALTFFVVQDDTPDNNRLDGNLVQSVRGEYGTLTVQRGGSYTYTLDPDVSVGDFKDKFENFQILARDEHNAVSEKPFALTIDMNNLIFGGDGGKPYGPLDMADGDGKVAAAVVEDTVYTASGDLDEGMPSDGHYDPNLALIGVLDDGSKYEARVINAEYGSMTLLPNGEWQYTLNNDHPAVQRLEGPRLDENGVPIPDSAQTITETFTTTYGTTITVTITGTNDKPFVTGSVGADTPLHQSNPDADGHMDWSATTAHGSFTARDIDNTEADKLTLHTAEGGPEVPLSGGAYTVAGGYGVYTITPDKDNDGQTTFTWTYELDQDLPDFNGSFTDKVSLWVGDGHGGFTQQDVSVGLSGTNTAPALTAKTAEVREDLALSVSGKYVVQEDATDTDTRIDGGGKDHLTFSAGTEENGSYGNVVAGEYGTLFLNADGSYVYRLNNANPDVQVLADDQRAEDVFWVRVSDGMGGQDHKQLVVTVQGTDGAPLLSLNDLAGNAGRGASLHVTEADGAEAGYAGYTAQGKAVAYDEDDMDQGKLTFSFGDGNTGPTDNPTTLHVHADGKTGATAQDGDLGTLDMAADGTYTFTGNPAAIAKLVPGEKIVVETTVVVADEHDNIDEAPLRITIAGTNTTPEITFTQPGATEGDKADGDVAFTGDYAAFDADGHDTSVYISTADGYATTLEGTYGRLTLNGDGTYTYTLHNSKDIVQALNSDSGAKDEFDIVVRDAYGAERVERLEVDIRGTNDNPVISVKSGSTATPSATDDAGYTGHLAVADVDDGLTSMTFAAVSGTDLTNAVFDAASGVEADGTYGKLTLAYDDNGDLAYTYTPKPDAVNGLAVGAPTSESFTVAVQDGHGGITGQTITVKVTNTNDGPVLTLDVESAGYGVSEAAAQTPGTGFDEFFTMSDADVRDALTYRVVGAQATGDMPGYTHKVAGVNGTLYYNETGENLYKPNGNVAQGAEAEDRFTVMAVDGNGGESDGITLAVTVSGENSAPTLSAIAPLSVTENAVVSGRFQGADADVAGSINGVPAGDVLTYAVEDAAPTSERSGFDSKVTGDHGTLYYNSVNGNYRYEAADDSLGTGMKVEENFTVSVSDNHGGLAAGQTLAITVTGTNDAPVVTASVSGALSGAVSFTDADTVFTGQEDSHALSIVHGGTSYPVQTDGTCEIANVGTFTLTSSGDRAWTYDFAPDAALAAQYRAGTSNAFTFSLAVSDGRATTSAAQTLYITGTNEAPEVALIPDSPDSGAFTVSDAENDTVGLKVDGTAITGQTPITIDGDYGTLTVDPAGRYDYAPDTLGASEADLGALDAVLRAEGNTLHELSDAFVFSADDGKGAETAPLEFTLAADQAGGEVLELRTDAEHILLGGGGDDAIAGSGEDILYGGAGDDAITAGDAFTGAIYGGAGDDAITVGSGDAALYGGAGDDAITLGAGFTGTAYGGVGNDIFVLSSGADPALVDGGEGLDFLLGAQSLESAEDMLNSGTLTGMDVVVIGPSSGITTVENLADYGITVSDGNKVVLDENWTRAGDKIGTWEVQENYDAYTTTTESGDLTLLVAKTATETSTG